MKKAFQILSFVFFLSCSAILAMIIFGYSHIPNELTMQDFSTMSSGTYVCQNLRELSANATVSGTGKYQTSVKLFNLFPIKEARVNITERKYVVPGGNVFGIRLYTKGVMIVKIESIQTASGSENPGTKAGLKLGDIILSADGVTVKDNASLSKIISSSNGKSLKLEVQRDKSIIEMNFTPALSSKDNSYKGGLWIRDSTAGIGTMTYYDKSTGTFAGLGHAICDVDTGEIMPLSGGDAVEAQVKGCYKGKKGVPGELCGVFSGTSMGNLYINGSTGLYGVLTDYNQKANILPVALPVEVKTGKAQIISTVDEGEAKYYDIEITKVYPNTADHRSMIIKVTDPTLIEKTGGIVQGMSGSPIIQNGMLVGAVTHVFIDNSAQGYGIFAQEMVETQLSLEKSLKLADAG